MKRFSSSDSLGAMVSICPPNEDGSSKTNNGYSREFQAMLDSFDEEDGTEETSIIINGKKRRLSLEKVKALEKYFEVDNKLEPERKAKIAEELNLQPRQVAIWFQNRRARWKAKQLEKDYGFLKSDYDALKHNYDRLEREKSTLNAEVRELKSKLGGMNENGDYSVVKEEALFSESENNVSEQSKISPGGFCGESDSNNILGLKRLVEFKDGSSDSDSSEMQILNDTNLNHHHHHHLWIPPTSSSSPMNWFQFSNTREIAAKANHQQFGKVEEQSFYGITEESCSFFPLDQSPTMHWYNLDQ